MTEQLESNVLFMGACDACGSSDGRAAYDDGHSFCFVCPPRTAHRRAEGASSLPTVTRKAEGLLAVGEFRALGKRLITEDTCRKYGYSITTDNQGRTCQVASFKRDGKIIAQKVRYPNKDFKYLGEKGSGLWGQHLFRDGGKMLVITEGEIDALTVSQLQSNKWPVVSLPLGAAGAKRAVTSSLEFVSGYDKVVLMFDMDDAGQAAALEVAKLLKPGQAYIASLPYKDPNECLLKGEGRAVISAMWDAKQYRPDGIIDAADLWDRVSKPKENNSFQYPWSGLNKMTRGMRKGELVVLTAGSGVGKSAIVREINYHLLQQGLTVGNLMLEENVERTTLGYMGLHLNYPLHLDRGVFTQEQLRVAFEETSGSGRLWLYDHFGSTSATNLLDRIRYLATACECDFITLDHISIAVSDADANDTNLDERKLIDMLMTKLRSLVEELGIGLFVISHLRRPSGDKGHEQGAVTSLSQLRGSHSIAQLADFVIGLERDQQSAESKNETVIRVLKNRFSGETGEAGTLIYDGDTGRLNEMGGIIEDEEDNDY